MNNPLPNFIPIFFLFGCSIITSKPYKTLFTNTPQFKKCTKVLGSKKENTKDVKLAQTRCQKSFHLNN